MSTSDATTLAALHSKIDAITAAHKKLSETVIANTKKVGSFTSGVASLVDLIQKNPAVIQDAAKNTEAMLSGVKTQLAGFINKINNNTKATEASLAKDAAAATSQAAIEEFQKTKYNKTSSMVQQNLPIYIALAVTNGEMTQEAADLIDLTDESKHSEITTKLINLSPSFTKLLSNIRNEYNAKLTSGRTNMHDEESMEIEAPDSIPVKPTKSRRKPAVKKKVEEPKISTESVKVLEDKPTAPAAKSRSRR